MNVQPPPTGLSDDGRWLAQATDLSSRLIRFVEMDPDAYRASSFLDDRLFQNPLTSILCNLDEATAALGAEMRRDARWIFHIGHVGSTLVSRLLGALEGVLAVREPRLLRDLAWADGAARDAVIPAAQRLLSRTFARDEVALVKATSFVSEIAPQLVPPGQRALFLYDHPQTYVETILAGENSLVELRAQAGVRARRMAHRVDGFADGGQSDAQLAAAAWACEMTALEAAAEAMQDRSILWARFDPMLDDMTSSLGRLATFFGFRASASELAGIAAGPLMRRYSKALEYEYSPQLRRELLAEAGRAERAAIDRALAMLDTAAARSPLLARALSRANLEV